MFRLTRKIDTEGWLNDSYDSVKLFQQIRRVHVKTAIQLHHQQTQTHSPSIKTKFSITTVVIVTCLFIVWLFHNQIPQQVSDEKGFRCHSLSLHRPLVFHKNFSINSLSNQQSTSILSSSSRWTLRTAFTEVISDSLSDNSRNGQLIAPKVIFNLFADGKKWAERNHKKILHKFPWRFFRQQFFSLRFHSSLTFLLDQSWCGFHPHSVFLPQRLSNIKW